MAFVVGWAGAAQLSAEQFHLVDGRKVDGHIIGFERNGFKVETEAGVVVIYRDQIRRIVFYSGTGPQTLEPGQTPVRGSTRAPTGSPPPAPEVGGRAAVAATPRLPADVPRPVPPPKPERMVEDVTATSYTNESFGFRFYKPPSWRSFPGLVKPDNPLLAALGTPDEKTLLLVGQEIYEGDLVTYTQLAEDSLRELYPDYRKREERFTRFAGFPALERHFTGSAEGHYWTGLAIYFAHGDSYYTFLGVSAEGETLDFQQSLLRKIVNTVEFGQRR
ncbi:MAG: hypothetical protein HY653_03055 [Acidobacteria bacterium]|nr:hypothetical protein [Acidobacteriota bacterium]